MIALGMFAVVLASFLAAGESPQGAEGTRLLTTGTPVAMVFIPASETHNPRLAVIVAEGGEASVANYVHVTERARFFPEDPLLLRLSFEKNEEGEEVGIEVGVPTETPSGWNVAPEERFFDDGGPVLPGSVIVSGIYRLEIGGTRRDRFVEEPLGALLIPRSPYIFTVETTTGLVSLLNMDLAGLADPPVVGSASNLFFDPRDYDLNEKTAELVAFPREIVSLAAEDFNGDGAVDLAVAASHGFYILPGNDKGHFLTPKALEVFEGDPTKPSNYDLKLGRREALSELMLLEPIYRAAEADFQAAAARYPTTVSAVDLNNDDVLDLLLLTGGPDGGIAIPLIGRGNGTFAGLEAVNEGEKIDCPKYQACFEPQCAVAGDFTENEWPDLVIAGESELILLPALGAGRFGSPETIGTLAADPGIPARLAADDFDGDGHLDVAVTNGGADTVDVYRGRGDGSFQLAQVLSLPAGATPSELISEDLDGPGNPDLAVACAGTNELVVFLHDKDCTFGLWEYAAMLPSAPVAIASDGPNLAVLSGGRIWTEPVEIQRTEQGVPRVLDPEERTVYAGEDDRGTDTYAVMEYSGNGDGTFAGPTETLGRQAPFPTSIAARGDDPTARDRWVVGYFGYPENARDGGATDLEFPASMYVSPSAVAVGSLNRTGVNDDVVVADYAADRLYVFFDDAQKNPLVYPTGGHPFALAIGDFDDDGLDDVAVLCSDPSEITVWHGSSEEGGLCYPIALGAIEVVPKWMAERVWPQLEPEVGILSSLPMSLAVGDFNNDGFDDLVAADLGSNEITVWPSQGNDGLRPLARFAEEWEYWFPVQRFDVAEGPISIVAEDFNGNGRADIATANYVDNSVSILWNRPSESGALTFEEQIVTTGVAIDGTPASIGDGPIAITTFELGDGSLWLAVAVEVERNGGSVFLLDPGSQIQVGRLPPVHVPPGEYALVVDVAVGDFDNDYIQDVAVLVENLDGTRCIATVLAPGVPFAARSDPRVTGVKASCTSIEALDLDGDSLVDLAVTHTVANEVTVLWGRGDGAFTETGTSPYKTHVAPTAIARLGELGFVVASMKVEVFMPPRGSPQVFEHVLLDLEEPPGGIAVGELNADGYPDLVVAQPSKQRLLVFSGSELIRAIGDSGAVLSPASSVWVGGQPSAICIGEFSGDPYPDISIAFVDRSEVQILLGAADFSYGWGEAIPVGASPVALTGTDFNHDGFLDLLAVSAGSRDMTFLTGMQAGTFAVEPRASARFSSIPKDVMTGDFSGDGKSDILIVYEDSPCVTILYDRTEGIPTVEIAGVRVESRTFQSPIPLEAPPSPSAPDEPSTAPPPARTVGFLRQGKRQLTAVRLDSDPFPDIILTDHDANALSVLLGSGDRDSLFLPARAAAVSGCSQGRPAIGDFDGDGRIDIAIASPPTNEVIVFWGGAQLDPAMASVLSTGVTPVGVLSDDLNGDNIDDLIVLCQGTPEAYVYLGQGGGEFAMMSLSLPGPPGGAVIADINSDGLGDLIVADLLGDQVSLFLGNTDGDVLSFSNRSLALPPGTLATKLLAGDLNHDGGTDLLILGSGTETAYVLYNRNYGRFDQDALQLPGINALDAILCDLDLDGYPDLVVVDAISAVLLIYRNVEGEVFAAQPAVYLVSEGPYAVASADFDKDGNPDAVVTTNAGGLMVLWGQEGGLPGEIAHRIDSDYD